MWGILIAIVVVIVVVVPAFIKIVAEYQRLVVFRLGRCIGELGPGLVILIPFVDRPVWVDLRESFLEIPEQTCITKDNAPISIDFLIYWKVTDTVKSVVQVNNMAGASQGIATTTLRFIIGDIILDDVLAKREEINMRLRTKMDEVTETLGRQGHIGRDQGDNASARDTGFDEQTDVRGTLEKGARNRGGRKEDSRHHGCRGRQAVQDTPGRGRKAVADIARRRLLKGA